MSKHRKLVHPRRDAKAQSRGRIADPQQEQPARGQCRANALQNVPLSIQADVMQHIEDYDRIDTAEIDAANVTLCNRAVWAEAAAGARHFPLPQFNART